MKDFVFDSATEDIKIVNGDLAIEDSDQQHTMSIIVANKGDYKSDPAVGVGIEDYLNDDNIEGMLKEIRRQLKYDGMTIEKLTYVNGSLEIQGNYADGNS